MGERDTLIKEQKRITQPIVVVVHQPHGHATQQAQEQPRPKHGAVARQYPTGRLVRQRENNGGRGEQRNHTGLSK
ncbi:MAG: hypothetical protein MUC38_12895 [Cyclobacteriaceae bacterium]|nr:hypothetical protein [Cyclobacteriaceae bacterium]